MAETGLFVGTIAENLESGLVNATDWSNLSYSLTENGLDAYNTLSLGGTVSNYLYVRKFNFNLPQDAVIKGISVKLVRRGTGVTSDYYVGLVYGDETETTITTPGKQIVGTWGTGYNTITYGGATDVWNKVWTIEEINSEFFGFAIAIQGNPVNMDSGSIDDIEINVYYTHVYSEVPNGSSSAPLSGGATCNFFDNITASSNGLSAAGHGSLIFRDIGNGTARVGGSAISEHSYHTFGGTRGAGSATVDVKYNIGLTGGALLASSWIVNYRANIIPSGGLKIAGTSPVENYYLVFGGVSGASSAISLFRYNVQLTGRALVSGYSFVDPYLPTGGALLSNSAVPMVTKNVIGSAGAQIAGSAINLVQKSVSGGVSLAGSAPGGRTIEMPYWDIPLEGSQEVPPSGSAAVGRFVGWINQDGQLSYQITHSGITSTVTSVTIHAPAAAGTVTAAIHSVVYPTNNPIVDSVIINNTSVPYLLDGRAYVKIRTVDYPNGEIRGQLLHFGAKASGTALVKPYIEIVSGGIKGAGEASVMPYWDAVSGGVKASGVAVVNATYKNGGLDVSEYSFMCNGDNVVPPILGDANKSIVKIRLDQTANRLYWDIRWNNATVWNAIRFRGPADKVTTNARAQILVEDLQNISHSPVIGSAAVSATFVSQILSGLWYLQLRKDTAPVIELRGQLTNDSGRLNGRAAVTSVIGIVANGGSVLGGSAVVKETVNIASFDNQIAIGGSGAIISLTTFAGGTALVGGSAVVLYNSRPVSTGGCKVAGDSIKLFTYRISPTGGSLLNGSSTPAIQPFVSGGILGASSAINRWFAIPVITGGARVAPFSVLRQTYAAQPVQGGVICAGRSVGEKIKYYVSVRRGYGAALLSSNILNTPIDTRVKLIDPSGETSVALDENRFRIDHNPGWCDVVDKCESGVLPKIVQRRQNGFLPPKNGATVNRDRRLATAS